MAFLGLLILVDLVKLAYFLVFSQNNGFKGFLNNALKMAYFMLFCI